MGFASGQFVMSAVVSVVAATAFLTWGATRHFGAPLVAQGVLIQTASGVTTAVRTAWHALYAPRGGAFTL